MRRVQAALTGLLVVAAFLVAPPAHAATVKVTVHLYRVVEISCDEGATVPCPNDYYPKFKIGNEELYDGKDDYCCAHGTDFRTNWVHSADVDTSQNPVDIHMELWDQDDSTADDPIDWGAPGDHVDLKFDLNTCVFTGGGLTAQQGAGVTSLAGESEQSAVDSARGYFTITTPDCLEKAKTTDGDGDGLMDVWEGPGRGLDHDGNGTVDLALGDMGALPYRKDLFVEADHMEGAAPQPGAITDVVNAFAAAPVDQYEPGKYRGVNLHVLSGEQVPRIDVMKFHDPGPGDLDDFNDLKSGEPDLPCDGHFGTAADRASPNCANILNARRQVYRYMIFGHQYEADPDSSGQAEIDDSTLEGGNDFIVTVATWDFDDDADRRVIEGSTFMHELGHTLSLGHGGGDHVNCKPNYLSVMSYAFQFPRRDPDRPLDYSSAAKGTAFGVPLKETELDENKRLHATPNPARKMIWGLDGKWRLDDANDQPVNWNGKDGDTETKAEADINWIDSIGDPGQGCNIQEKTELKGHDDWAGIQYNPRLNVGFFADGVRRNLPRELTERDLKAMTQQADLKLTKTADRATAAGGDTISYTVGVTDLGPGPARSIEVADTLPDGTVQRRSLPDLAAGATTTTPFAYQVPCTITDGTVITNTATVTGTDAEGVPDPSRTDNTASAATTARAPKLTVSQTATPTVGAGEAITYTITYANAGGDAASNVAVTATVPKDVYYSKPLDLGAGPKPATVTLNADGTRTLTWNPGDLAANSGDRAIVFTARPTLLALPGATFAGSVSIAYKNGSGACVFAPVTASSSTTVTAVAPSRNPMLRALWALRDDLRTAEILARVQATDTRWDGADGSAPDGRLSQQEADAVFSLPVTQPRTLRADLLATVLNTATRRINAGTVVSTPTIRALGLGTVGDTVRYAQTTLAQPPSPSNLVRYAKTGVVLTEVNAGVAERY
ncbi:DUF11 domain-containing protein [Herbidospora galbida]|uniref:DUF11 domain-containing protein n=1 Tax=Herbidospora galbida TaxID=2575442 RepID=A0A4U3LQA1_9ACTN|nr:DUF11 domain-containing protein [Herbidospora galbida]TKK77294.1 DUF11 domain-containing protein [Herbidospora galbida]